MDRYDWTDGGKEFYVTEEGIAGPLPSLEEAPAMLPDLAESLHRSRTLAAACREILRLAEENTGLKAVIARAGDIRRAQPVLDAALTERDRLAERVRELEAERDRAWDRVIRERDEKAAPRIVALEEENRRLREVSERLRQPLPGEDWDRVNLCACGHSADDHRGGGLCDLCIPVGDSTGMRSGCQTYRPRRSPARDDQPAEL